MSLSPQKQLWKVGPFARTCYYRTNGTGRDSYIVNNNGGTTDALRETNVHPISGRFLQHTKNIVRSIVPTTSNKTVYYYTNGSGRDNYIAKDSGGMMGDWSLKKATREFFLRSLRNNQTTYDMVQKSDNFNPLLARKQRSLTVRLAQPKREQSKFQSIVQSYSRSELSAQPSQSGLQLPQVPDGALSGRSLHDITASKSSLLENNVTRQRQPQQDRQTNDLRRIRQLSVDQQSKRANSYANIGAVAESKNVSNKRPHSNSLQPRSLV